jgi:hypothetical protein
VEEISLHNDCEADENTSQREPAKNLSDEPIDGAYAPDEHGKSLHRSFPPCSTSSLSARDDYCCCDAGKRLNIIHCGGQLDRRAANANSPSTMVTLAPAVLLTHQA